MKTWHYVVGAAVLVVIYMYIKKQAPVPTAGTKSTDK